MTPTLPSSRARWSGAAGSALWPADHPHPARCPGHGVHQPFFVETVAFRLDSGSPGSYSCIIASVPRLDSWSTPLPTATPPSGTAVYQLPTGTYETRAALAISGGSFRDRRHFAATAVLVQHPKGDLLIDAGFGADVASHVAVLSRLERAPLRAARTVDEQLRTSEYDRGRLLGVLVTHSHWDHVSGLADLQLPIWINDQELSYAAENSHGKVFGDVSAGHQIERYELAGPSYLGFPSSWDVHGDGSIVVAFAGGHTTGSVVVFVAVASGERYAFIGDLTWQLEGITRGLERPLLIRALADSDAGLVRQGLARAAALAGVMHVVPAHDVDAYAGIPLLPARRGPHATDTVPPR